jgi:hypothetical protein
LNVNYRDIQTFDPNKVEIKDNEWGNKQEY